MTASEENSSSGSDSGDSSDNEKQRVKSTIRRVSPSEPKNSKSSGSDRSRSSSETRQSQRRRRSPTRSRSRSNSRSKSRQDDDRKNQGPRDRQSRKRQRSVSKSRSRSRSRGDKNDDKKRASEPDPIPETPEQKARREKKDQQRQMTAMLTTRTGGAYIPPAKLRLMQEQITDKASPAFQRLAWEALKKSINGLINKVNSPNIAIIVRELFAENIVRGRGLLCQSIMQAQTASPTFTHVYAGLVAIINTKFPAIGELLLKRLIINFRRGFKRNDKIRCMSSTRFIAHLVNQQIVHELISLEILTLLLDSPTDDSVEVAITFLRECGQKLSEVSPRGINAIFESLRTVLHESNLDKRTQYMIEVMFQVRKDGFKDNPAVLEELDLVEEEDQFTHTVPLIDEEKKLTGEEILNVFKFDPDYEQSENKYQDIKKSLLGDSDSDGDDSDDKDGSGSSDDSSDDDAESEKEVDTSAPILDQTETNIIALRRTIYLTIQSSLDFEETVHKLMKLNLKPGHEMELCHMVIDCCAQQRTYEKFFGLLAQRLCQLKREYIEPFQTIFVDSYNTCHRLEIGKLRNVTKMFAHLLFTDAIGWVVLSVIHLNEHETTSSSRIFIKMLLQELAEYMGLSKLLARIRDATMAEAFEGLFPRDDPANTRFSINFFTSIGLGGLTEELRDHLKSSTVAKKAVKSKQESSSSSSSSSSDSSSSTSSSSSSEEERAKRKRKKLKKKVAAKKEAGNRKQSRSRSPRPEIKKVSAGSRGDRSRQRDDESASPSRSPTQHRRDRKERPDSGKVPSFGDRRDASRDSTSSSQKRNRTVETSSSRSKRANSASSDEARRRKKSLSPVSKKRKNGSDSPSRRKRHDSPKSPAAQNYNDDKKQIRRHRSDSDSENDGRKKYKQKESVERHGKENVRDHHRHRSRDHHRR